MKQTKETKRKNLLKAIEQADKWFADGKNRIHTMQAILTKCLPATNTKCPRIKAECGRGSLTIWEPKDVTSEDAHRLAVKLMLEEFCADDLKVYGTPIEKNPWSRPFVSGGLPDGTMAHVFLS